jgi:hypothetical protein
MVRNSTRQRMRGPKTLSAAFPSKNLACGDSGEGLRLIEEQISVHPRTLVSFTVLRDYYYAQGDFQKARKAESDGTLAITGH